MNLLRRIASLPGIRAVLLRPGVRRRLAAVLALRFMVVARQTTSPWRLLRNEYLRRDNSLETYAIKATGVAVPLQHGRDLEALFELFERGEYEPPGQLADRLSASRVKHVLDIGANVGMFSARAVGRWPAAEVTAYEPSPDNADTYREWAASRPRVTLIEACASTYEDRFRFDPGYGGGSRRIADSNPGGIEVAAVDVLPTLLGADFVKIDIEGGEWEILADPRLGDLHDVTLVMEYHRYLAPSLPAGDAARRLLEAAGFTVGYPTPNYWGHGTLWAWKD